MAKRKAPDPSADADGVTIELRRFQLLVRLFRDYRDITQAEMARRTGIDDTHLSKLCNTEKISYTGLSADIVRKVRVGMMVSPDFFFDPELRPVPNESELLTVYSLDEQREKKWKSDVDERLFELTQKMLEVQSALLQKDQEINRLRRELDTANGRVPRTRP